MLDVNALIALGVHEHVFHSRVKSWLSSEARPELVSCAITEIGFIRVISQAATYGFNVGEARELLMAFKRADKHPIRFVADNVDASEWLSWVKTAKQVTDGHLVQLAKKHQGVLATLDAKIPGAFLIPADRDDVSMQP